MVCLVIVTSQTPDSAGLRGAGAQTPGTLAASRAPALNPIRGMIRPRPLEIQGLRNRVYGLGFGVWGLGFAGRDISCRRRGRIRPRPFDPNADLRWQTPWWCIGGRNHKIHNHPHASAVAAARRYPARPGTHPYRDNRGPLIRDDSAVSSGLRPSTAVTQSARSGGLLRWVGGP